MIFLYFLFFLNLSYIEASWKFNERSGLNKTAKETGHLNTETNSGDLTNLIGSIINVLLSLVGVLFLILALYAGFLWITARGDEKQIEEAQKILRNSIIGLIIVASAYAITAFIGNFFANFEE